MVTADANMWYDAYCKITLWFKSKYTEYDIMKMLECPGDNIFVGFPGMVSQQIVGIQIWEQIAPLF